MSIQPVAVTPWIKGHKQEITEQLLGSVCGTGHTWRRDSMGERGAPLRLFVRPLSRRPLRSAIPPAPRPEFAAGGSRSGDEAKAATSAAAAPPATRTPPPSYLLLAAADPRPRPARRPVDGSVRVGEHRPCLVRRPVLLHRARSCSQWELLQLSGRPGPGLGVRLKALVGKVRLDRDVIARVGVLHAHRSGRFTLVSLPGKRLVAAHRHVGDPPSPVSASPLLCYCLTTARSFSTSCPVLSVTMHELFPGAM